ncbi:hypothetical protein IWW39_002097 [Coemansia spiralis]|uniref:ribonuclease H n=1 Tax=Coemansia spiralis TaxID=417178 RepID=A0A9W8GKW7_9FUNG|nr:hypothetical protein IWW39_002097 [Coemansia spiralis]
MSMTVYTGGSCVYPGTPEANAGIGVFLGPGHKRNFSGRLPGKCQTSNRAEFGAIKRALLILSSPSMLPQTDGEPVFIMTRSKYAIGCVTIWLKKWARNGWLDARGRPVANKDLIVDIIILVLLCPYKVLFMHSPAIAADKSSVRAKELAAKAARNCR